MVSDGAQVGNDVGAVTGEQLEEADVREARDGPVEGVVDSVEPVDLVRLEGEVEHAGDRDHYQEADEEGPEVEQQRGGEGGAVEGPARQGNMTRLHQRRQPGDFEEQHREATEGQRQDDEQGVEQLHHGVARPPPGAAVRGAHHPVVHVRRLPRRTVPVCAGRDRLTGVQGRGLPQLSSVTQGRLDVEHRVLADEHVLAEGDRARLDHSGAGPVAREERVLADDGPVTDGEQVGADGQVPGEDHHIAPDLRSQRPQVEHVDRRPGEQDQRVGSDQGLDDPEAEVGQAPDADLFPFPPADEDPLRQDRKGAEHDEGHGADEHRSQVVVDQVPSGRDPLEAPVDDERGEIGRAEEEEEQHVPDQVHEPAMHEGVGQEGPGAAKGEGGIELERPDQLG